MLVSPIFCMKQATWLIYGLLVDWYLKKRACFSRFEPNQSTRAALFIEIISNLFLLHITPKKR